MYGSLKIYISDYAVPDTYTNFIFFAEIYER